MIEKIIYVADPMCSWCWGFAPELSKLRKHLNGAVEFSLLTGGLRDGHVWDDAFKDFLRSQWKEVQRKSGQPFNGGLLEKSSFDYTTEPACRAVCTAREFSETKAFKLFEALQYAFYQEGRDITSEATITQIALETGLDPEQFAGRFGSDALKTTVHSDRHKARAYGASSFPSLVVIDSEGHLSTIRGYRNFDEIIQLLRP